MSDNIKVVVKVRPLISREIEEKLSYQWRVKDNTLHQLDSTGRDYVQSFTFDKVYDENTETSNVYNDIAKPIVEAATAGFNGTIFAYGQTSSGKTYTMTGTEQSPGIIPLAVVNLFEIIKNIPDRDFLVRVSYIEIYNETLKDLLNVGKECIKIHDTLQGIKVDATENVTSCPEEVLEYMKKGEANRQTGSTFMNDNSSRSHSIFQIIIESREHVEGEEEAGCVNVSQLNLVDLAGSERAGQTGATGIRFKEGTHINKSLSALAMVIKQLSEDPKKFTNYRDSKLTRILQNSLGGNAKTSIICAVTPAAVEETISTLQFANRAKAIKNRPEVNAVTTNATMIQSLTKQLSKLQSQLESKKNLEQDNYNLQKQIAAMQRLILNGFGQTRSEDIIGGTRRKLQQPRRKTISTLHSIRADSIPNVPKFCTPIVKYNPMLIPSASDFVPLQNPNKLASLPEEPASRLVTPPPNEKKVNFNDEIIEINSDDDDCSNTQTCSPYHNCHESSKTPPCILRKNAKQAEKDLRDIVKLTERERMYTPGVNELLEKREKDASVIAKLHDEVESLNRTSKDKELEINELKAKLKQTEIEVKTITSDKLELKRLCEDYKTKITDWEVIYDTLKNKARLREEELLSLLEEQKLHTKSADIGKISAKLLEKEITHFMDMSKDISLVNSDNESSIVTSNDDEPSAQIKELLTEMQTQLTLRNQTIAELEANLEAEKQQIKFFENSCLDLQEMVNSCKENINCLENENVMLKSTVENLNSAIKSQKQNLETARNDIASYNSVIQELHIKLTKKESILNMNVISDSALETMVANEQKFIANNDNIKNIIHTFKMVLDTRNKEISQLKSTLQNKTEFTAEITLKEELAAKTKSLEQLNEEVHKLKEEVKENIATIHKLICEKGNLAVIEQDLANKLTNIEEQCKELQKLNKQYTIRIEELKENNENLTQALANKNEKEQEHSNIHEGLLKKIEIMTNKMICLEDNICIKDNLIASINTEECQTQDNLLKAKTAIKKLQNIFSILTGDIQQVPEIIDNFVTIFTTMIDTLTKMENIAINIIEQRDMHAKNSLEMKEKLAESVNNHKIELIALHNQIVNHVETENKCVIENNTLSEKVAHLSNELSKIRYEVDEQAQENSTLFTKLQTMKVNEKNITSSTIDKEFEFKSEIDNLHKQIGKLNAILQCKQNNIDDLSLKQIELDNKLSDKCIEITMMNQKNITAKELSDQVIINVFIKLSNLIDHFSIENNLSRVTEDSNIDTNEQVFLLLDKIATHITLLHSKNKDTDGGIDNVLAEAKHEISILTQENLELIKKLSQINGENRSLACQLQQNQNDHKSYNGDLIVSQKLLKQLQMELKEKSSEIEKMELKALEWKSQFMDLDILMKRQMQELQNENDKLKSRFIKLSNETKMQIACVSEQEVDDIMVNQDFNFVKTMPALINNTETNSPPSLLTICCDKIVECIQPNENDSNSVTISSTDLNSLPQNSDISTKHCMYSQLSLHLKEAQDENNKLMNMLEQMQLVNEELIREQEEVRKEVQLLLQPAQDLQKKIASHKTNLSILTATTYAENKSLKSQVKGLQHHHSRFHTVCQRDIPAFKMQLNELMTILKGDFISTENVNFKRFSLPDVLDGNSTLSNLKNESTLDGDLLMLDTNVTLTTCADNTLLGCDQTCLEVTFHEASSQTNEINETTQPNIAYSRRQLSKSDSHITLETLEMLIEENNKLRDQINKCSYSIKSTVDAQSSPIKTHRYYENSECTQCRKEQELRAAKDILDKEIKLVNQELLEVKSQKQDMEKKYDNLLLEVPSTDALVLKLNLLEKDYNVKVNEIAKLSSTLSIKNKDLELLQEENNALSTQVIENISESDDLNKEIDKLKEINVELADKCLRLKQLAKESNARSETVYCSQCILKDKLIQSLQNEDTSKNHSKLNRSFSDSDTASRYNKICTLQNELHAGREDCKELTEEVVTIKNQLESSSLSMDLDGEEENSHIFSLAQDFEGPSPQHGKCNMTDIAEERLLDIYMIDKIDCFNYYVEKTGIEKESLDCNVKIIDVMKRFYSNLIVKHGNEVDNFVNKLRDHEELKKQLETQIKNMSSEFFDTNREIKQGKKNISIVLSEIKKNISIIDKQITTAPMDTDTNTKIVNYFKDNVLQLFDNEYELSAVKIFEFIIENILEKHQKELTGITDKYIKLQDHIESVTKELNSVNDNLAQMKRQYCEREAEYNLLTAQKERIHEISNAVTLDIIKREHELNNIITESCQKLLELEIINPSDINLTTPFKENIKLLIEHLIQLHKNDVEKEKEKDKLMLLKKSKINEIEKNLKELKIQNKELQDKNNNIAADLLDKENKLKTVNTLHEDLKGIYERKMEENATNRSLIQKLTEEIDILKDTNLDHEKEILSLTEKENKITELLTTVKDLSETNDNLKTVNKMILNEKESYATELEKSGETIRVNNIELDRLTSDILVLRESVKENTDIIDSLKQEAKSLLQENMKLKAKFEEKSRDCSRLETNIKTHEKTAEVQSRMIMRLQKQNVEQDSDKVKRLEELTEKCSALQQECEVMKNTIDASKCEIDELKHTKETLEARVTELKAALEVNNNRLSIDAISDTSRRRRQSLYDSKRLFSEDKHDFEEQANLEEVFMGRDKPDDLFMDLDDDTSNRSSPFRRRDSLLSRTDQSDKEKEQPARAGSVVATRRRRQSSHDVRRSVPRRTRSPSPAPSPAPSPHDYPSNRLIHDLNMKSFKTSGNIAIDSEMSQLRDRLVSCQQELEDLKEKYRELDDECETCAEYLRERDEQCLRLKREKKTLEHLVTELKEKLQSCNPNNTQSQAHYADACVNTDEDWTNLHSVVVDRMSYDAEVEKNKKFTKIIEELRFKKQELKNTISKMQKALDKHSAKDNRELEATKQELEACKLELEELKVKYKELDEECEMCAEYLKERDEQCRKLKEAKAALEEKLQKVQEDSRLIPRSVRKKRQNIHDLNRGSASDASDAFTETTEDFLSYQVERDDSSRTEVETQSREIKRLKMTIEKLSHQKAELEQRLKSGPMTAPAPQPMYVATGSAIVQNQQLTDVMKENQRLKKINAKLVNICKKRGKSEANRENEDPSEQG